MRFLPKGSSGLSMAMALAILLPACRHGSVTEPEAVTLRLVYQEPTSFPPGDPAAAGCAHSYAPAQFMTTTSWGASVRLGPSEGTVHSAEVSKPPAGNHWISVVDYRYCSTTRSCPTVASGLFVDGVALHRPVAADGSCTALAFTVSPSGTISP